MIKNKINLKLFIVAAVFGIGLFAFNSADAQLSPLEAITYPISELGDCANTNACKTYCNNLENMEACLNFAKGNGLVKSEDTAIAVKLRGLKTGPGGCTTKNACQTYCNNSENVDECVKFAQDRQLLSNNDLLKFRRFHEAVKNKRAPGECHDQNTCETFCAQRSNNETCLKFAREHELIEEMVEQKIRKFRSAVEVGETPGDCATKEACAEFCASEENKDVCLEFAEKQGFLKKEDAERLKKEGFKGPGGCDSKESCEAFCNEAGNQQACLDFAQRIRMIDSDEVQRIKDATKSVREELQDLPEEVRACLRDKLSANILERMEQNGFTPDPESAEAVRICIMKYKNRVEQTQTEKIRPENELMRKQPFDPAVNPVKPKPIQDPVNKKPGTTEPVRPKLDSSQRECVVRLYGGAYLQELDNGTTSLTPTVKEQIVKCMGNREDLKKVIPPPPELPKDDPL